MTRAVSDRILKDANGDNISDHLRNHIHLTNCIHLKNHMHKHNSPMVADRSFMKDLLVLQRSRSLRDPSASPPSWHSPSVIDMLSRKKVEKDEILEGRRSVGIERRSDGRRLSGGSPHLANFGASKVVPGEASLVDELVAGISDRSSKSGLKDGRRVRREKSSLRSNRTDVALENKELPLDQEGNGLELDVGLGTSASRDRRSKQKGKNAQSSEIKTLFEQMNDASNPMDDGDKVSSNANPLGRSSRLNNTSEEPQGSIRGHSSGLNRAKRRRFRAARRTRAPRASREVGGQNEMSVASNSFGQGSVHPEYGVEEQGDDNGEENVARAPTKGCGIPWNWSRIHHRGRNFLDMAGKSLSCGLSDSRLRKGGATSRGRDFDMPVASDYSSSSAKSADGEALPLLVEASGSQYSTENAGWVNDYSGELGIYANNLLKQNFDSDLASEARSGERHKLVRNRQGRHQNFAQKYMPRTFSDLVGQNLVSQALSNAATKRKVGLLYVFYGPHGTGKTSCARIFARALNCESLERQRPCGFCKSCIAHDKGKSRSIREVGPVSNFDFERIMDLLDNMIISNLPSQYRVFIFDDCDSLSAECWNAISKVIDRAPRRVVFILVSSSLDVLPHIIISRCQKFFFPKVKDADIIYRLQLIASKENIEIDKDAVKLIASRSDGSLRDAEMTLEQLSLLGLRISVPLVQELVGLISDEKLVDLLDLALSADTANTVKSLRVIMETGVDPLALMSQLAAVITDILAGTYDFSRERNRRKFFRRHPLSKDEMEKVRQALKTLSEAEKQLRMTNDKITWLTAALLQLAPDQQYALPVSSTDTSFNHSPLALTRKGDELGLESPLVRNARDYYHGEMKGVSSDRKRNTGKQNVIKSRNAIEEIWLEVLDKIQIRSAKEFLEQEGKLFSVNFGAAPTVQLMFSSFSCKSKAEKYRGHILQAFESVLGSPVTIEIRYETNRDAISGSSNLPLVIPAPRNVESNAENQMHRARERDMIPRSQAQLLYSETFEGGKSEIVELPSSPRKQQSTTAGRRKPGELSHSRSIVRGKVSLAHVIQQAEGCTQRNGWTRRKAVSIAEKLEQENLRLEAKSRSLLCWKASRVTRRKLARLKIRARRPHTLLKLVSCGKCLSSKTKSPR